MRKLTIKSASDFDKITEAAKQTELGKKVISEMEPLEMWIDDIDSSGKIIGRLELFSRRYEKAGD